MRNWKSMLLKVAAAIGVIWAIVVAIRTYKTNKESGQKVGDLLANEVKLLTHTKPLSAILALLIPAYTLFLLWMMNKGMTGEAGALAFLWASIPASTTATVNFTFIPQYIAFTISTVPTSIQINVQGDGIIYNLDGTGVTNMNNIRQLGSVTNKYLFQLANGLVNGKNGSITVTNAAAAVLDIQGFSQQPGDMYITYQSQQAIANSGFILDNFGYAAFPSAAATDQFTVEYNTGITQNSNRDDLNSLLFYRQNVLASRYAIDNIAPTMVRRVTFIPAAAQNIYVLKYQSTRGVVNAAVNS